MAIHRIRASFAQNSYFGHGEANLFTRASREMLATFATDKPTVFAGVNKLKPEHLSDGTHDLLPLFRGVGWYEHTGGGVYGTIHETNLSITRLGTGRFRVTSDISFITEHWGLVLDAIAFTSWPSAITAPLIPAECATVSGAEDPTYGPYAPTATVREFDVYASAWGTGTNALVRTDPDAFFVGTLGDLL